MKVLLPRTNFTKIGLWLTGLVLSLFLVRLTWNKVTTAVNNSYQTYAYNAAESLSRRLNHANTYYWYARYRKNSQPEFERAWAISQEILREIGDSTEAFPAKKNEYASLKLQAQTLRNYCQEQSAVSQLNIASYVPMYLEMMAHDESFMEQDCEDEEVETRAANRAIDVILDLTAPEKNTKIGERPLFALVHAQGESKAIHESIIQKLNAESKFYTISDHELVKILGEGATYNSVFNDSASLVAVSQFFGAKSIALIELINNDKVDGIHYYGMRYNVWQQGDNAIKDGVYTEYFVRNRNFNQMTLMKLPLLLLFLGLLGALGFGVALVLHLAKGIHFSWYSLWISLGGALVAAIGIIDYLFMQFLNPLPSDYYATDAGEIWQIALPLALLLIPVFINYILLGRLDKHIKSYQSRLDEPSGLFILLAGGLAVIPLVWTNYRLMRFGIEAHTWSTLIYAFVLYVLYGLSLSRWVFKIIDFPQKVDWRRRTLAYAIVGILVYLAYSSTSQLIVGSTLEIRWGFAALVAALPLLMEFVYAKIPVRRMDPLVPGKIQPVHMEELKLTQGRWSYRGKQSPLLRVLASKSLYPAGYLLTGPNAGELEWHIIDFSQRGDGTVHYHPYAKTFEHLFTHKRFNDVAEQSRIIGNLLGKLIGTISSVGDYLIDESDPKPRNVDEVAEMIVNALGENGYGLVFQHPESAEQEDLDLFRAILSRLVAKDYVPPVAFCEGIAYALQEEFDYEIKQFIIQIGVDPVEFELAFKDLAQSLLSGANCEPTTRVLIEERLISSELDQSPVLAERAIRNLLDSPQVFTNDFGQIQLKSAQFEFARDQEKHHALSDLRRELRAVLDAAAIASDDSGTFHIDLVTAVSGMTRKEVLSMLDELQALHLVFDRQDDEHLDLYQFADIETIKELRQEDEHERDNISQNVREYYRAYVAYYLPHASWIENQKHLLGCIEKKLISERELTFLAMRALRVSAVDYIEELLHFVLSRTISEGVSANFDGAKQLIERYKKLPNHTPSQRLQWLEFVLLVETGSYPAARNLYETRIRETAEKFQLSISDLLLCVRYCFGDFMHGDNAQHGKKLNEYILQQKQMDRVEHLRAAFYTTKLIANRDKNLDNPANKERVSEVIGTYERLVSELSTLTSLEKTQPDDAAINLFKEVLNDYMGFLADTVWSKIDAMPEFGLHKDETVQRFDQLKAIRLRLEKKEEANWLDPSWVKRGTDTDYRGLCFTYNFIQRGLEHLGKHEESIKAGRMSFTLNSFVGDHNGKQVCAGYLSKAFMNMGNIQESLYWAEQSVAYAHTHGLYSIYALSTLARVCEKIEDFSSYTQLSRIVTERHTVKHFDDGIPSTVKKRLLLTGEQLHAAQTELGSRFNWGQPVDFDFIHKLAAELQKQSAKASSAVEVEGVVVKVEKVQTSYGKSEFDLTFPAVIGTTTVVPIDSESPKSELITRGGSQALGVRGIPPQETQQCALIVHEFGPQVPWHIATAHPGVCAPQLPKSGEPVTADPFWSKHAFIISEKSTL